MIYIDVRHLKFLQGVRDGMGQLRQCWDDVLGREGGSVAESYIKGTTEIILVFEHPICIKWDFYPVARIKVHSIEFESGRRPESIGKRRKDYFFHDRERPMFVLPVDLVQTPQEKVLSAYRLDLVEKKRPKPTDAKFFRSVREGDLKPIQIVTDRKIGVFELFTVFGDFKNDSAYRIVKAGPQISNNLTNDYRERKPEWICDGHKLLGCAKHIAIGERDVNVTFDVALKEGIKIVDVLFGPIGLYVFHP